MTTAPNKAIIKKPKKAAPVTIKATSACLEGFLKKVEKKHNKKTRDDVGDTATLIVQDCVDAYCAKFGKGDVGASGTAVVSKPFKPTAHEEIPTRTTGLLYGKVQSGKTNAAMGATALALENGFRVFVVLTSDNVLLGQQTLKRFRKNLGAHGPKVCGWEDWSEDPESYGKALADADVFQDTGAVFVSTKNHANLASLLKTIKKAGAAGFPSIIIDDEADNASLNTFTARNARSGSDDASATFDSIGAIRRLVPNHIYLQVTATPQSLLLQSIDHECRPVFCVLVPPGEDYIGGDIFFADDAKSLKHRVEVDAAELDALKGNSGKLNPGGKVLTPKGLRMALCTFFVGAAQKMLEEDDDEAKYTLLIHISQIREDFKYLKTVAETFTRNFDKALRGKLSKSREQEATKWLTEAHTELAKTCKAIRPLKEIIDLLRQTLTNVSPEIIDAGAKKGEVDYRDGLNILIGGNRLGRGLTIDGLMVTYYGRDPKTPMSDTVHQHARMFGYRQHLLDVTRIFSAKHLLDGFKAIHESDEGTRKTIGEDPDNLLIKPVWIGQSIRPTRSNVLNPADVGAILPSKELYPRHPRWKRSEMQTNFGKVDELVKSFTDDDEYRQVKIDELMKIISLLPSNIAPTSAWEDQRIIEVLKALKHHGATGRINVRRGKGGKGTRLSRQTVDDGTGFCQSLWVKRAKEEFGTEPTLILKMEEGRKEEGWEGSRLYLPTLITPSSEFVFVFNYT